MFSFQLTMLLLQVNLVNKCIILVSNYWESMAHQIVANDMACQGALIFYPVD